MKDWSIIQQDILVEVLKLPGFVHLFYFNFKYYLAYYTRYKSLKGIKFKIGSFKNVGLLITNNSFSIFYFIFSILTQKASIKYLLSKIIF